MQIETILTPAELPALAQHDLRATVCVVFDMLRASNMFVTRLHTVAIRCSCSNNFPNNGLALV